MRDFTRRFGWAAVFAVALGVGGCSEDSGGGGSCDVDGDCARGTICVAGACTVETCRSINDCPGSGRTCLADLRQCSPKECGDAEGECSGGQVCVSTGPYRFSCAAPDALACDGDEQCAAYGAGLTCCGGTCQADCPAPIPEGDAGPTPDMSVDNDATPGDGGADAGTGDAAPLPSGRACSPCQRDADCAELGAGATCTPFGQQNASFCMPACEAGQVGQCPSGYTCVQGLNYCLPTTFRCDPGCLVDGCPEGSVCDAQSGECSAPRDACGLCALDADCADGLSCTPYGGRNHCLAPCADGACADGYACQEGTCQPVSGRCDACGGRCADPTPYCVESTGQCAECGPRTPCPNNLVCNLQSNTCEERTVNGCVNDVDCSGSPAGPFCFGGECVQCLQDHDCGPGQGCDTGSWACVPMPCRGVQCHGGGVCDPQAGRCNPACRSANDCPVPGEQDCNVQTGQCFFLDGSCDPAGRDGVCAPGSTCSPNLFDPNGPGTCSCEKEDPTNPLSPDIVPCNPGSMCLQFIPGSPGFCLGLGI